MPLPFMAGGGGLVSLPDPIVANWGNMLITGGSSATNADITITFGAGPNARSIYASNPLKGTLSYRINSGSWVVSNGTPFTITSGQTLGWKWELGTGADNETITIRDGTRGDIIDTFTLTRTN